LSVLTGRVADHLSIVDDDERIDHRSAGQAFEPVIVMPVGSRRRFVARTVYLSDRDLRDVDRIIEAWQQVEPRRLTRSAIVRRAVEHLRAAVEADLAPKSMLEND
jgi:hypothetical protein